MKARIRLHKLLSVLLCCIMLVGMLPLVCLCMGYGVRVRFLP